jgi:hypothetical protein
MRFPENFDVESRTAVLQPDSFKRLTIGNLLHRHARAQAFRNNPACLQVKDAGEY